MTARAEQIPFDYLSSIGGSQCSAALGIHPYSHPITLWQEFVGELPGFKGNEATEWGSALEPLIRARYAREHDVEVVVPPSSLVANENWARISPDGIVWSKKRGLEVKTAGVRSADRWGDQGTDDIPHEYVCQSQWYMWGTGLDRWDVAVLIGGQEYREYIIERDDELIENLVEGCRTFWHENVLKRIPPGIDGSDDYRDYLIKRFPDVRSEYIRASEEAEGLAEALRDYKAEARVIEQNIGKVENMLRAEIGDASGLFTELGKITCRPRKGRASWKQIAEAIAKEYNVPLKRITELSDAHRSAGSRPLTTPQNWNK